jgi:hypothetical protein
LRERRSGRNVAPRKPGDAGNVLKPAGPNQQEDVVGGGRSLIRPAFTGELAGPGQWLDVAREFAKGEPR